MTKKIKEQPKVSWNNACYVVGRRCEQSSTSLDVDVVASSHGHVCAKLGSRKHLKQMGGLNFI